MFGAPTEENVTFRFLNKGKGSMLRPRLPLLGPRWIPVGVVYILVMTLDSFFILLSAGFVLCRVETSSPLPGFALAVLVALVQGNCVFFKQFLFFFKCVFLKTS